MAPSSTFFTIAWRGDCVEMLDQRKLPLEESYVKLYSAQEVAGAISDMVIRGAPAIGVAAAMGIALGLKQSQAKDIEQLEKEFLNLYELLLYTRPTAVNLRWALDRMKLKFKSLSNRSVASVSAQMEREAMAVYQEDVEINRKMGQQGKKFILEGAQVLTYCNTGALATAGYGTALGVIRAAFEEGKSFEVFVSETRPYLQGLRLTSWELHKEGIPQTVITDNMAASLMAQKKIDAIFVGADRIARNGDTANKIGTYALAVLGHFHKIPFYVVAPTSTIDQACSSGQHIPIEERRREEIMVIQGHKMGLDDVAVYNPSFDVTPAQLISAIVTEKGVVEKPDEEKIAKLM